MNSLPVPIGSYLAPLPIGQDSVPAIMAILNAARIRQELTLIDVEERAGVSKTSWHGWRQGIRKPTLDLLICVAQTLGYEILVRVNGAETQVQNVPALMSGRFDARRRKLGLTLPAWATKSGLSVACWSAVAVGRQSPRLATFVALANALDFEVLLRARAAA